MSDAKKMLKELAYTHLVPKDEQGRELVAVVRCKDCIYCHSTFNEKSQIYLFCEWWDDVHICGDGFCSYGERKENEE